MNYYEHHIGDFLKRTIGLSMLAEGAYRRLLDCYYTEEKPLPGAKKDCYDLARTRNKAERDAVDQVLEKFFTLQEDGYHKDRCDDEIARYKDKQEKAKRSANARWANPITASERNANASPNAYANASPPASERNATRTRSQSPVTSNQTQTPPASAVVNPETVDPPKAQVHTLGKFSMRLDWVPNPEILEGVLFRAGANRDVISKPAMLDFIGHFAEEQAVYTETQWCQKLLQSAKQHTLRNPKPPEALQADGRPDWLTDEFCEETARELDAQRNR